MSVYVVELVGKVAMSLKPKARVRLRPTTSFFTFLELFIQARLTLLEETLVAVRSLGATNPAHAPAASVELRTIANNSLPTTYRGFRPYKNSLKDVTGQYETSINFFGCKCIRSYFTVTVTWFRCVKSDRETAGLCLLEQIEIKDAAG